MWPTSQGDRTLGGNEAMFVRAGVGYLRDMITAGIDLDEAHETDVELFNQLQPTQQLAIVHEVAFGLLDKTTPILELTAIREATVFVIYREVLGLIEIEIDANRKRAEPDCHIRSLVLAAFEETQCEGESEWCDESMADDFDDPLPTADSTGIAEWERLVENLADEVLWDRDFEMETVFADCSPQKSGILKKITGIADNFFSTPSPDIYAKEYHKIDLELTKLIDN